MLLYHGTKAIFDEFSLDYLGMNNNAEGAGIYFTDSIEVAKTYAYENGRILTVEVNGQKPLDSYEITLSRDEISTVLTKLHEMDGILDNFNDISYYGIDYVLEEAIDSLMYNTNDMDIVSEISNTYGDSSVVLNVIYKELGYDHTLVEATWGYDLGQKKIYIAFTPEIINIIKNDEYKEIA